MSVVENDVGVVRSSGAVQRSYRLLLAKDVERNELVLSCSVVLFIILNRSPKHCFQLIQPLFCLSSICFFGRIDLCKSTMMLVLLEMSCESDR